MKYSEFKKQDGSNGYSYDIEATDLGIALTSKTSKGESVSKNTVPISTEGNPWS